MLTAVVKVLWSRRLHAQGRRSTPAPERSRSTHHTGGFWGMSSTSFVLE